MENPKKEMEPPTERAGWERAPLHALSGTVWFCFLSSSSPHITHRQHTQHNQSLHSSAQLRDFHNVSTLSCIYIQHQQNDTSHWGLTRCWVRLFRCLGWSTGSMGATTRNAPLSETITAHLTLHFLLMTLSLNLETWTEHGSCDLFLLLWH